jgi:outer membrane protein OmpA-like peptidoglycan-associated protein
MRKQLNIVSVFTLFTLSMGTVASPQNPQPSAKPAEHRYDLNGEWQADFTLDNSATKLKREKVMVQQIGDKIIATKITGDEFVPAGKVTVRATYGGTSFPAEQACAESGYKNPYFSPITITILDARHFKATGGCSGNVTWERVGNPTMALDGSILFDFDKYQLKPDAEKTLVDIAKFLGEQHPRSRLMVAGFTDDIGTDAHNLRLSQQRAQSVAAWMKAHGFTAARLSVQGFGKKRPRYPNTNEEARSRNRRVEIEVLD